MAWVPNRPLRKAFEESEVTAYELARHLGYTRRKGGHECPDYAPIRRALGLCLYTAKGRQNPPQTRMRESTALRYAEALGLDPVDIGL